MNAIPHSIFDKNQKVELVGKEKLSLPAGLARSAGKGSHANIVFVSNAASCNPRLELHRLLDSPVSYSASDLEDAERALARIAEQGQISDNEWAQTLGEDLAKFTD